MAVINWRGAVGIAMVASMWLVGNIVHAGSVAVPDVPDMKVNLSISPYIDQSEAFHGIDQGFYGDVGITIGPDKFGINVPPDQVAPLLAAGSIDFGKTAPSIILPSLPGAPMLRHYAYSDLFLGYAIVCQKGFKTVADYEAEGMGIHEAVAAAVQQLVGKTFVMAPEAGPAVLYNPAFKKGGISLDDMEVIRVQDAQGLALMKSGEGDCQLPGVPIRITLESLGMAPVVTSLDVARVAEASLDSLELRAVSLNGWATTQGYWEKNRDTVLRMASVGWRINDYIEEDLDRAIASHIPFVNQLAGTNLGAEEGMVVYTSLDPFYTFDGQTEWFQDQSSIFLHTRLIDVQILALEESGEFPKGKYTYKDISIAEEVYQAMLSYKMDAEDAFRRLDRLGIRPGGDDLTTVEGAYAKALQYHVWRDYLDAARFAEAALAAAN